MKRMFFANVLASLCLVVGLTACGGDNSPVEITEEEETGTLVFSVVAERLDTFIAMGARAIPLDSAAVPPLTEFRSLFDNPTEPLRESTAQFHAIAAVRGFSGFALGEYVKVAFRLLWDNGETEMPFGFVPMASGSLYQQEEDGFFGLVQHKLSFTMEKNPLDPNQYIVEFNIPMVEGLNSPLYYLYFGVGVMTDRCFKEGVKPFVVGDITYFYGREGYYVNLPGRVLFTPTCSRIPQK